MIRALSAVAEVLVRSLYFERFEHAGRCWAQSAQFIPGLRVGFHPLQEFWLRQLAAQDRTEAVTVAVRRDFLDTEQPLIVDCDQPQRENLPANALVRMPDSDASSSSIEKWL